MSENLHNIDKLFQKAIEEHEEVPSTNVWNQIDKGLDKNKVVSIQRKYYVLKRVAVALFIFGFVASVFAIYFNSRYYKSTSPIVNKSSNEKVTNKIDNTIVHNNSYQSVDPSNNTKKNQSTYSSDHKNLNSNTTSESTSPSSPTSLSSAAALSSENYNKINKLPSSSSPSITAVESNNKQRSLIHNKSNQGLVKNKNEEVTKLSNNKKDIASKQTVQVNAGDNYKHSYETISNEHLLYAFQPSLTKSVNRSNIASVVAAPISKLKKQAHLSVTVFGGPEKNINHLRDGHEPMRPGSRDDFRHSEQSMSSVRTGILFEYPLASNWSIGSGAVYSSSITSIAPKVVFARADDRGNIKYEFNCSAGYAYIPAKTGNTPLIGDSAKVFDSKTRISYISIPITAGYNLAAGKFIIKPSAGLLINFLTNGKIESSISSNSMTMNSTNPISGLKSSYLSGEINLTAIYQLNNKVGIMLAPGSQFALSSINKNTSVKTYPGYVGITGGVRVAF